EVWCWGAGMAPRHVAVSGTVAEVATNFGSTLVRLADGEILSAGPASMIGRPTSLDEDPTLRSIPTLNHVSALGVGPQNCAIANYSVACWGKTVPVPTGVIVGNTSAFPTQVSLSASHACARLSDGSITCWGQNELGELGDGTTKARGTAVSVVGLPLAAVAV